MIDGTVWTLDQGGSGNLICGLRQGNQHVFGGRLLACFDLAGTVLIGRC